MSDIPVGDISLSSSSNVPLKFGTQTVSENKATDLHALRVASYREGVEDAAKQCSLWAQQEKKSRIGFARHFAMLSEERELAYILAAEGLRSLPDPQPKAEEKP
jgi:hypothetical protein